MAWYRCPLCGTRFKGEESSTCRGCPLARRCSLISCPRCGYEFPALPEEA